MIPPLPDNPSLKVHIGLILLAGFLFVYPSLNDGLVSDDYELIEEAHLTGVASGWTFFTESGHKGFYRPVPRILLGINYAVHGLSPFGYHLINALLHLTMCTAVYRLTCKISRKPVISLVTSILFAVHFIHVEPVYWVSARNELLVGLIYILILILMFRDDAKANILAWSLFLLGLCCKETAITIPLAVGLLGIYLGPGSLGGRIRKGLKVSFPFWCILTGYAALRWMVGADWPWTSREVGFGVNPLLVLKNTGQYIIQLLIPVRSLLDLFGSDTYTAMTDRFRAAGGMAWIAYLLIPVGVILIAIIGVLHKSDSRMAFIGLIFVFLTGLPYFLMEGTGLRYMYLPSVGFLFAIVAATDTIIMSWGKFYFTRKPLLLIALPVAFSLLVTLDQTRWWDLAGRTSQRVVAQVQKQNTQPGTPLYVFNIPRRIHAAYIFHNGFEAATRLYRLHVASPIYDGDRFLERNDTIPADGRVLYLNKID